MRNPSVSCFHSMLTNLSCKVSANNKSAHCDCRDDAMDPHSSKEDEPETYPKKRLNLDEDSLEEFGYDASTVEDSIQAATAALCEPGQYWCDQWTFSWVMTCEAGGHWKNISFCGQTDAGFGW